MEDNNTCVERKMSVCPWHHLNLEWDRREKQSTFATEGTNPSTPGTVPWGGCLSSPIAEIWRASLVPWALSFSQWIFFHCYSPYSISKETCLVSKTLKNQNLPVCCFLLLKKNVIEEQEPPNLDPRKEGWAQDLVTDQRHWLVWVPFTVCKMVTVPALRCPFPSIRAQTKLRGAGLGRRVYTWCDLNSWKH